MPLLSTTERRFLQAVASCGYANPFDPALVEWESEALGAEFKPEEAIWSFQVDDPLKIRANSWAIVRKLEALASALRKRLEAGSPCAEADVVLYEDAHLYLLYYRYFAQFNDAAFGPPLARARWSFYTAFRNDWAEFFEHSGVNFPSGHTPAHTFALYYQIVRAFHYIFDFIIGNSKPAGRLRAAIWESIFTCDIRRFRRTLYSRMGDFATLITGPSGTGKELVAQAISLSRYEPFDENRLTFGGDNAPAFLPLNIAALSSTLVESELFGHKRGSFTGALQDRKGYLESCPPLGAVFLDEIGELSLEIQVKLLRVIETRTFHPVGDAASRRFHGKLLAATNRDLAVAIQNGRFREDLYYRLCSDLITTPSLSQQIAETPTVLRDLVLYMARRSAGPEGDAFAPEAYRWIEENLGPHYPWPGNYRELEQCIRNLMIRREYRPAAKNTENFLDDILRERLTAEQLLQRYCALVYHQTGSYEGSAEWLGIDRRTVKSKVEGYNLGKQEVRSDS